MMTKIIELKNLDYYYGNFKVLNNINLSVSNNTIFGFLGPNGAGKTTTIKILLGLLKSQKNTVHLFGKDLKYNRIEILSKTGALVENPSIYNHLTAYENIKVLTTMLGIDNSKINDVLAIVKLSDVAHKKAGKFSTGMKQRLGIAKALVSDPQLIILDEPTIGLDPEGIVEIRNLLLDLKNNYGKTVFLSSHNLNEIEKLCDEVGIINKGEVIFKGTIGNLNKLNTTHLLIKTDNTQKTSHFFNDNKIDCTVISNQLIKTPFVSYSVTSKLISNLVKSGFQLYEIEIAENNLEELFINLIKKQNENILKTV